MLDKMIWKVFENTGNINAYLLYVDIKCINNTKKAEINASAQAVPVKINN